MRYSRRLLLLLSTVGGIVASVVVPAPAAEPKLAPLPAVAPAPDDNPSSPAKVALGKQLFFDPRLSGDNTMSCATCHLPEQGWTDGRRRAVGAGDRELTRNTPSVWNVGHLPNFFWDGRAATLEEQALGPITSPDEMNQDLDELERELAASDGYRRQFADVFGAAPTRGNVAQALAAFQRTLNTGPSPVDRYLAGEKTALSALQRRGLELFTGDAGCVRCHHGPTLSDGKFYRLGVAFRDAGRAAVTGDAADRFRFRTPPLRNVALTAPYMHDGSLRTLADVVMFYLRDVPPRGPDGLPIDVEPQVGVSFSDTDALVAFLEALSGPPPRIEPPTLPE